MIQPTAPLPESWHKETFANKPPIHKQFMTEDQGTIIWEDGQPDWEWYRHFYRAKIKLFDDYVGKVIAALKENGLWDNTVIVSTSDHGDMDTHHRLIFKGPFLYEHMVRIPGIFRVPEAFGGANSRRRRRLPHRECRHRANPARPGWRPGPLLRRPLAQTLADGK